MLLCLLQSQHIVQNITCPGKHYINTAHSDSLSQVRNEFYKDSQGVILVYDVGQKESFDALDIWLAEMKQEIGSHSNMENIVFTVCANKVGPSTILHKENEMAGLKLLDVHYLTS